MTQILSYLAFDWGQLRVGVASGNSLTQTAQGVSTLDAKDVQLQIKIEQLIVQWRPYALVVGVPYYPDGKSHKNTKNAKNFAQKLRDWTALVVHEVDERYSTTEALADLGSQNTDNHKAKRQAAKKIDAHAACIILEQYLRSLT
jgi:putative holliday junction resolvase